VDKLEKTIDYLEGKKCRTM